MRTEVLEEDKKEIEKMLEAGFIRHCTRIEEGWAVASLRGFQGPQ
jgi:hypothetical protein